jgi:hypothetical protein
VREALANFFPAYLPIFNAFYTQETYVNVWTEAGWNEIPMQEGVMQGDPFSMFLFCCAVQPLLEQVHSAMKDINANKGHVAAYADDWSPVGSVQQIRRAFQYVLQHASRYNLELAVHKCGWFSRDLTISDPLAFTAEDINADQGVTIGRIGRCKFPIPTTNTIVEDPRFPNRTDVECVIAALQAEIPKIKKETYGAIRLLGSYIGDDQHIKVHLLNKVKLFGKDIRKLNTLQGMSQVQLALIRESFSTRFDHLARSIPPETFSACAAWFD